MIEKRVLNRVAAMVCWLVLLGAPVSGCARGSEQPAPPQSENPHIPKNPTRPYLFSLGGLTPDEVEALKRIPGVQDVKMEKGRAHVVWQFYVWDPTMRGVKNAARIYDFLAIKGKLGNTEWTHGGRSNARAGTVIDDLYREQTFSMKFDDRATGHNENMRLMCYCEPEAGQVEHEMLRYVAGTRIKVEKCGDGYVLVSRTGRGVCVVWQLSDQMFVRIDNSYDKEMVGAYVNRLGSVIPKDYRVSLDKWVENEIRWRLRQIDRRNARDVRPGAERGSAGLALYGSDLIGTFPQVREVKGRIDFEKASPAERWEWLNGVRHWLWANRANFRCNEADDSCILKGKDLYDPKNPPELPEDLRGPPRPAADKDQEPAGVAPSTPTEVPAGKE